MKCLEIMSPFIANGYTATAIVGVCVTGWAGAPVDDFAPPYVKRVIAQSMCSPDFGSALRLKASAGLRVQRAQVIARHRGSIATVALAKPHDLPIVGAINGAKHYKASKPLTGNVNGIFTKGNEMNFVKWELGLDRVWDMILHVISSLIASGRARASSAPLAISIGSHSTKL